MSDDLLRCRACGEIHAGARLVTLPDGQVVGNHSEEYRAFCEAKFVVELPTKERRRKYIEEVERHRGLQSANALRRAVEYWWNTLRPRPAVGNE